MLPKLINLIYLIRIIRYDKCRCKDALFEKECKTKKESIKDFFFFLRVGSLHKKEQLAKANCSNHGNEIV